MKRIIENGFGDTFQEPDISDPGRQQSNEYYADNRRAPLIKSKDPLTDTDPASKKQQYLSYQKEIRAKNVSMGKQNPKSPGKILKLPLDYEGE